MSDGASSDLVLPGSSGRVNEYGQRRRLLLVGYLALLAASIAVGLLQPVIEPTKQLLDPSEDVPIIGPLGTALGITGGLGGVAVLVLAAQALRKRHVDWVWLMLCSLLASSSLSLLQWHVSSGIAALDAALARLDPLRRPLYAEVAAVDARQAAFDLVLGLVSGACGFVIAGYRWLVSRHA